MEYDERPNEELQSGQDFYGIGNEQANEFGLILRKLLTNYSNKSPMTSDKDWLIKQFQSEIPLLSEAEAESMANECVQEVETFDSNLQSLNEAVDHGTSKERWFAEKIRERSIGLSIEEFGAYLQGVDQSIQQANEQMSRVIINLDGSINQNMNLDGFIAEQHHVNSFNLNANLQRSPYFAKVAAPQPGETYKKNSFDVVIWEDHTCRKRVHQYQFKYGATAQATIRMIKAGNYNNQRIVVPSEQLEEIRKAFPGKTIVDSLGNTDVIPISSEPLSKPKGKIMQRAAQTEGSAGQESWNHFKTKDLALRIGKNAAAAGVQAAAMTAGFDLARKMMSGEKIEASETIGLALKTGADAGIKAAATAAVKIGVEKGVLSFIPKSTPVGVLANMVCVGIENIKILGKVASSELTISQGLDRMGRTTTCMAYGLGWSTSGAAIGAAALGWVPLVGPFVGSLVGGTIGYMAGSKVGEAVYGAAKSVAKAVGHMVSRAWENGLAVVDRALSFFSVSPKR